MSVTEERRPRVLFVDHTAALGGAELCLLDVAGRVGHESSVVLFEDGPFRERLAAAGVPVRVLRATAGVMDVRRGGRPRVASAAIGVARLSIRLARLARGYDVLYANTQKALVVSALAGAMARRPVVWHLHDLLTEEHFGARQRGLVVRLARRFVRRVIANSEATRDAYVRAGGRPEGVHVIYNGIDASPFDQATDEDVARLRRELGVDGVPLVGLFGRLAPWKGQGVLLDALADMPGVHALLVGQAAFAADRGYANALRQRTRVLDIADRVHMLGFRDDVAPLMRACDIVVHTSSSAEPFGRVIVEGMLAGRPVVATRAGGAVELIEHGETGLLVPRGDAGALRNALVRLLGDEALRRRLAEAAGASARTRFDPMDVAHQIDSVVATVAGDLS